MMFSSSKRVSEQQLVDEVKQLIGKHVMKDSKQTEQISLSSESLFIDYLYIYIYITQREIWDNCGLLKGLSAGNLLMDSLITDIARGADSENTTSVTKNQREMYEKVSNRLHKANSSKGDDDFDIKLVATEALNLLAEKISGKKITELQSEGFDSVSKFLIISKHCFQFDKEVGKLLSKRTLA